MTLWPYKILRRDDNDIKADFEKIMQHFAVQGKVFDNAGYYLSKLFVEKFGNSTEINMITVRRASTVAKSNPAKEFIFKRKKLSDFMRHVEVFVRLCKVKFGIKQKMNAQLDINFNVTGKKVLVIDDSVDTGTTLSMVQSLLLKNGAVSVTTACISNHLLPEKVSVDYSVYTYRLLRTRNSRDYNAA